MGSRLTYLVPAHNEQAVLERNLRHLADYLAGHEDSCILVVENGSRDDTLAIAQALAGQVHVRLEAFHEEQAGLGHAYDRGLREAEGLGRATARDWLVLSAADLPFGFSDVDAALGELGQPPEPAVMLGSKAHPSSVVEASLPRRAASWAYRWARRIILDMQVRDCQGTLVLRGDVARELRPQIRSRDYFYTTELVYWLERRGEAIVELPVVLHPEERRSTVRLFSDGLAMGAQLVALRRRGRDL